MAGEDMSTSLSVIPERSVEDFFDNEYLNFAVYVVRQRAIPSVIDGFKPTQRKAAHAANKVWKKGTEKPLKVFQLAGTVAATTFYHHGNASLESCIIGMTQGFKNSFPIFEGIGQFGSLRSPEAGAPRYVGVKFNENFRRLYKDFDLVTPQYEEGEEIEPKFFLPIVPTVLLNGGGGIAVGFATKILNRNLTDLVDACLDVLAGRPIKTLTPWLREFHGTFLRDPNNPKSWTIKGDWEVKNTTTVEITEIPPSFTYEKYEQHLMALEEKGFITSFDDMSSSRVNYIVKFTRQKLNELLDSNKLETVLKLSEKETENLTTLDENGKLRIFNNAEEIVKYFVNFRLEYYVLRKAKMIENLTEDIQILTNRVRFIKAVISDELKLRGVPKDQVDKQMEDMGFDKECDSYEYLLRLAIQTLTQERMVALENQREAKIKELEVVQNTTPKQMYEKDLRELKSQAKGLS